MNYITDKEIDAIQGDMGETLRKQPRVRMRIEGSGYWEGGINGWFFRVRRGEETELPKSIAELIQRSEQVAVMGVAGLHICSMGERILRCETAPVVALTAVMYATGNLS